MKNGSLPLALLLTLLSCLYAAGIQPEWTPPTGRQLSSNSVTSIVQDSEGYVWIGTRRGLNRYNGNVFVHYLKSDSLLADDNIVALFPDEDGDLCVVESSCIDFMHGGRVYDRRKSPHVRCAAQYSKNAILLSTDEGLWLYRADIRDFRCVADDESLSGAEFLAVSGSGAVWCVLSGGSGIEVLDSTFSVSKEIPLGKDVVVGGLLPFGDGGMLCALNDGLRLYSAKGERLALHPSVSALTQGRDIVLMGRDEALDRVIIGLHGEGMYSLDMRGGMERVWTDETLDQSGAYIFFVSEEAVWLFNSNTGLHFRSRERSCNRLGLSFLQSGDRISGVYGLDGDYVLVVSRKGAFVQNIRDGGYRDITPPDWPDGISSSHYNAGELLAYTGSEVLRWSLSGLSLVLQERGGIRGNAGLLLDGGKSLAEGVSLDVVGGEPSCVAVSADGTQWVGTDGNGLLHISADGRLLGTVTEADGLADNTVMSLLSDESGVWVSGRQTVTHYDGVQSTVYDLSMESDGFVRGDPVLKDGRWLIFPCRRSLVVFDIMDGGGRRRHKIDIDAVVAGGASVPFGAGELRLSHWDRQFAVYYSGMNYDPTQKPSYQYRLDGYDRDWTEAGQTMRAAYSSLKPGHYTFRVRMRFRGEDWGREEAALALKIARPPWASAGAWCLYAIMLSALLGVLLRLHRKYRDERDKSRSLADTIERDSQRVKLLSELITVPTSSSDATAWLSPKDKKFVEALTAVIDGNMDREDFKVSDLPDSLHLNRSTIFLKVKELFGVSPQEFILDYRLSRAAELLLQGEKNVSEVAWSVGFGTLNGFSKAFKAKFGISPSKWVSSRATAENAGHET